MTLDALLQRTVGQWQSCPLWILRGRMFTLAEKSLIIGLLDLWHTAGRPNWFYGSNVSVARLAGLSPRALQIARRQLLRKCVLNTKPGRRGRPKLHQPTSATAYQLSEDFLYTLAKNSSPLNTRSTSVDHLVSVFPIEGRQ